MLQSIRETSAGILQNLNNEGSHSIPNGRTVVKIPVRSARKSANDKTQEKVEIYPQCILDDKMPVPNPAWNRNRQKRVDNYGDFDSSGKPTTATTFEEPLYLDFAVEVTFFVKDPIHRYSVMDYMMRKYQQSDSICLNAIKLPGGTVGDFVSYTVNHSEVTRSDGIYELNYNFIFHAFVNCTDPDEQDLVKQFNLGIQPKNL